MTPTETVESQDAKQRSVRRGRRFFGWLIAAVASVWVLAPGPALAGTVTQSAPSGKVHVAGLTAKERAALDIVSVTATGDDSLGVYVTATFKGNFERAVGRGHLKHALAALVLRFKPATKKPPSGLVTSGPGIIGQTTPRTPSEDFGVMRNGRQLTFFITGAGSADLASIEVKTFATQPRVARRAQTATSKLEVAQAWKAVVNDRAADAEKLMARDLTNASCAELMDLQAEADSTLVLADLDQVEMTKLGRQIATALADVRGIKLGRAGKIFAAVTHFFGGDDLQSNVKQIAAELRFALLITDRNLARNQATHDSLVFFKGKLAALIALNPGPCHPPKSPPPPSNKTLGASFNWAPAGQGEVRGTGGFFVKNGAGDRRSARPADATSPLDAVTVVIPPAGSTPRQIINTLCPTQLPMATVSTTTHPNDTLTCSGGSLPVGQQFSLNVQTNPAPTSGMGGQLYGHQDGTLKGPFTITGP